MFDALMHVEGDKTVFGYTVGSGGIEEGEQVIRMLANHPSAARFISTKLVRRFVADDPPTELVEAASRTFEETGGDIREVLKTILLSPQFLSADYRDALREADISPERVRVLGGWAGGAGASDIYGGGLRPSTLYREIRKVKYPGLDLSHLLDR